MVIIQVVPRLPPAIDGVGDYALNLARQLRQDFGIETYFVVSDPTWTGATDIEGFPVSQVTVYSATTLLSLLSSGTDTILLHYVGYGYAKRGCPFWLIDGLERWRNARTHRLLVTMFHEVYASGPPWTSSFWLSPLQKNLASRLIQLSDRALTSKQDYANYLEKLSQGEHTQIPSLPVFSNIGEPKQVLPLAERQERMIVFGGCASRLRVYRESLVALSHACQLLGIKEIWDIGPSTGYSFTAVNGVSVVEMGQQSAAQISDILSNSLAGYFNYNPNYLAKSTIFAAYCAHGVLPIGTQCSILSVDGIEPGKHYWIPDSQTTCLNNLTEVQAIANHACSWYQTHKLSVQARVFFTHLTEF